MFLFYRTANHAFEFGLVRFSLCLYKGTKINHFKCQIPDLPPATNALKERSVSIVEPPIQTETQEEVGSEIAEFKMEIMGTISSDANMGPPVHTLVEKTWSTIFTKGLSKESKEILLKKYPAPQNLQLARAPILNTEVRQAISLPSAKRDNYQFATQHMIEAVITIQASLMSELLKPEESWDTKRIFELANDAGRLTAHVQYHLSRARRALITPTLTASAKNALDTSPIDRQLFGEQYLNKMKDAAAADKLVKSLTKSNTPSTKLNPQTTFKPQFQSRPTQGNSKAFVKKTVSRSRQGTKAMTQTTRHQSNSRSRSYHRI